MNLRASIHSVTAASVLALGLPAFAAAQSNSVLPCTGPVYDTVAQVCAGAGNTCNATDVTIGGCTTLRENREFDFGDRKLTVTTAGTLQINPLAQNAPGEDAAWVTARAQAVDVFGRILGTLRNANGGFATNASSVIRVVADGGEGFDLVIEETGRVLTAGRGRSGAHVYLETVPGGPGGPFPGDIIIAGQVRANWAKGGDIVGDPVFGGKVFLDADDVTSGLGGKIHITETGQILAGATDQGGPGIFMAACDILIEGIVNSFSKTGKHASLEPYYGDPSFQEILTIDPVATTGIDEKQFFIDTRYGGAKFFPVVNPAGPTPPGTQVPLPLNPAGAVGDVDPGLTAASAGSMIYGMAGATLTIAEGAFVGAEIQLNIGLFDYGLVAFKVAREAVIEGTVVANGAPPNTGIVDIISATTSLRVSKSAIITADPINPKDKGGTVQLRANLDLIVEDASLISASATKLGSMGGSIILESFSGKITGLDTAKLLATGQGSPGSIRFKAVTVNIAPSVTVNPAGVTSAPGTQPDIFSRCLGSSGCACVNRIEKAGNTLKVKGEGLGSVSMYFYKATCDPAGCPGASCKEGTIIPPASTSEVTLTIPAGTPANSHVIAVSDTGFFCTFQTFTP